MSLRRFQSAGSVGLDEEGIVMKKNLSIVEVNMGNLSSIRNSLLRLGVSADITNVAEDIENADVLILPGVGSFGECMNFLKAKQLVEPLRRHALELRKPILGICLGMQLFADCSEEHGISDGLGLIPGRIVKLCPDSTEYRVPNMGWCDVNICKSSPLFPLKHLQETFYFVHSYYFQPEDKGVTSAVIRYAGQDLTAAVESENMFGVQFHPEKSQEAGLNFLESFLKYAQCL